VVGCAGVATAERSSKCRTGAEDCYFVMSPNSHFLMSTSKIIHTGEVATRLETAYRQS